MSHRFAVNALIWFSSKTQVWEEACVVKVGEDDIIVEPIGTKERITIHASKCFPKEDGNSTMDDMTKLSHLHEPGVLHNLHQRYLCNQIYTYTGNILIALNPFTTVGGLYDDDMKTQYRGVRLGELAPHVFAVADNAYRAMIRGRKSQSILISGESGAGKTETTKLVMEYIAELSGRPMEDERSVEARILESNPILEAFGNAKTARNHNSSRFGKFVQILFDSNGKVSGAVMKAYLLEKTRVVQAKDPERSYHCFYQLCDGATQEEAKVYMLPEGPGRANKFYYLNQSSCYELSDRETDAQNFLYTKQAMTVMGISKQEQVSLFKIISAILHLGNVVFLEVEDDQNLQVPDSTREELDIIAALLQCDRADLEDSLTSINRRMGNLWVKSPLNPKAAAAKRDSLAKNLYAKVFSWIVNKINEAIAGKGEVYSYIAVLDIYGFEHFDSNSFEQFCINLANEKLQQHFNQTVLKSEQDEYEHEQINWTRIAFNDNQDCVDLIEQSQGILSLLDDACKFEGSTAQTFTERLNSKWGTHRRISKIRASSSKFTLNHYAGEVNYNTEEFIAKNADSFTPEHERLLKGSQNEFISSLFPNLEDIGSRNKFVSLGNAFKVQLNALMHTLFETEPHYIRCVKPNLELQPGVFDRGLVIQQLRSGGVLEAVRLCSAGYPARQSFADVIGRFDILNTKTFGESMSDKERCKSILSETSLIDYQVGKTKVFFREGQMMQLETIRLEILNKAATKIQQCYRRHYYGVRRLAAIILQTWWRGKFEQTNYKQSQKSKAVLVIQTYQRMREEQRYVQKLLSSVIFCQRKRRAQLARRSTRVAIYAKAAVVIQRNWRTYQDRKPWIHLRKLARGQVEHKELVVLRENFSLLSKKLQNFPSAEISPQLPRARSDESTGKNGNLSRESRAFEFEVMDLRKENKKLKTLVWVKNEEITQLRSALSQLQSSANREPRLMLPTIEENPPEEISKPISQKIQDNDKISLLEEFKRIRVGGRIDNDVITKFVAKMAREAEVVQQLKKQNNALQGYHYTSQQETEKLREDAKSKDKQMSLLEEQVKALTGQLKRIEARKARLETEAKVLGTRLMDFHPPSNAQFLDEEHETLLRDVKEEKMGFNDDGFPIAANLLFNAMVSGRFLEIDTEEPLFLSRVAKHIQETPNRDERDLAYWLTNAVSLYFSLHSYVPHKAKRLVKITLFGWRDSPHKRNTESPALLTFKCKLRAATEQLYVALVNSRMKLLDEVLQNVVDAEVKGKGISLQRSVTQKRRHVTQYWDKIMGILHNTLNLLCIERVPMYLLRSIMKHLIAFINCRVFNSMMVQKAWCPLTFSNGEAVSSQLDHLKKWLIRIDHMLEEALGNNGNLSNGLEPLQQVVTFLMLDRKPKRTIEEIENACPSLNYGQILFICQNYSDAEYGTKGVDHHVIDILQKQNHHSPLLLKEEKSFYISIDDVVESMKPATSLVTGSQRS